MYKPPKGCELEKRADELLAPYATKYQEGERLKEEKEEETYRTRFRRDRDRILYTTAFRRLQYKTQVFVNYMGDHYRTRLTHTLEVEQLTTGLADALRLNRDLVSAISFGHDLGHTPFGHAVEKVLNDILEERLEGGFSHAIQGVRYVEYLAKHKNKPGLNLCRQVTEGILKHNTDILEHGQYSEKQRKQWDCDHLEPTRPGSLETQVCYWADIVAYLTHDLDDFYESGLKDEAIKNNVISEYELEDLWSQLVLDGDGRETRDLVRNINTKLIEGTSNLLEKYKPNSSEDIVRITESRLEDFKHPRDAFLVNFDDDKYKKAFFRMRELLKKVYLGSPTVSRMDNKASTMVRMIAEKYLKNPKLLPWSTYKKYEESNYSPRVIIDHIAGMTDRYATKIYNELFMPWRSN